MRTLTVSGRIDFVDGNEPDPKRFFKEDSIRARYESLLKGWAEEKRLGSETYWQRLYAVAVRR